MYRFGQQRCGWIKWYLHRGFFYPGDYNEIILFTVKQQQLQIVILSKLSESHSKDCSPTSTCQTHAEGLFNSRDSKFAVFIVPHRSLLHLYFLVSFSKYHCSANSPTWFSSTTVRSSLNPFWWWDFSQSFSFADLRNKPRDLCLLSKCCTMELNPQPPPKLFIWFTEHFISSILVFPQYFLFFFIELHFHIECLLSV